MKTRHIKMAPQPARDTYDTTRGKHNHARQWVSAGAVFAARAAEAGNTKTEPTEGGDNRREAHGEQSKPNNKKNSGFLLRDFLWRSAVVAFASAFANCGLHVMLGVV